MSQYLMVGLNSVKSSDLTHVLIGSLFEDCLFFCWENLDDIFLSAEITKNFLRDNPVKMFDALVFRLFAKFAL